MSEPVGFNRHKTPDSVQQPTATITTPKSTNPLESAGPAAKAWPAKAPLPSSLPTAATKGDAE